MRENGLLFKPVNSMQLNKEQSKRNNKYKYLMGRRLKCSKCGYSYVGRTRREINQYYYCKGKEQRPTSRCDMPQIQAKKINSTVWRWVEELLLKPSNIIQGHKENQKEITSSNTKITNQIAILNDEIIKYESRINKLLELYLDGQIEKIEYGNKKIEFNNIVDDHKNTITSLRSNMNTESLDKKQIIELEEFIFKIRDGLQDATFETKRRIIDLLDVRGKLAKEDNQRIIYISCKIMKPQRSLVQTSHL